MKVLVVDDEKLIRDVIKEYLLLEKMEVMEASDGEEAIYLARDNSFDIIIMDIMMPRMDGYHACKKIKEFNKDVPFIFLSARAEEYDKIFGFELGIDDYVTKPFSPKELVLRIKAITKRGRTVDIQKYVFDGLVLDDKSHEVYVDNKLVVLTPKEYDLLKYLMDNKNIAITRENLLSKIWGYDYYGEDRTIDTHIKTLRKHLGKYSKFITTLRKVGYKFEYQEKNSWEKN